MPRRSRRWRASTASRAGARTSTPRSTTATTRCSSTPARRRCARRCWPQALRAGKHVYCEKPIATNLNEAVEIARLAQGLGPEAWRGAGQAVPARAAQAGHAAARRLLRPHAERAHRVRLLGLRRRPAADPAAELELPQGRRRRHHPGHDVPLALRAGQPVRRGAIDHLPGRDAHPAALGRGRPAPTPPRPTTRPTPPSS